MKPTSPTKVKATPKRRSTRSRSSTSSRRGAVARPDSLDGFALFCEQVLTLENGDPLVLEAFQRTMLTDLFGGARETLILLPKKNGKTSLLGALAIYHLCTTPDADCVIAAASRDQAAIMLRQAQGYIRRSPGLQARLTVKQREIVHEALGGRVRVLASDVDTADGVIPTLALVDELHRHRTSDLYGVFRDGLGPRDGQLVTISTAGFSEDSALWRIRAAAIDRGCERDGAYTRAGTEAFVLHEWSLLNGDDLSDLELVKQANPLAAMTVEKLRERHDSPTMTPGQWSRFACNVWTDSQESWIKPEEWDACAGEPDLSGLAVYSGVDIGQVFDSSAVCLAGWRGDKLHVTVRLWNPRPDKPVDIGEVERHLLLVSERERLLEVAYDPARFGRSAEILGERGLAVVEFPQSNTRMVEASNTLYDLIREGRIVHDGDAEVRSHVLAGVAAETESGWRISKRKSRKKIDALIALALAAQRAVTNESQSVYETRDLLVIG